jgi:hypothetical protein
MCNVSNMWPHRESAQAVEEAAASMFVGDPGSVGDDQPSQGANRWQILIGVVVAAVVVTGSVVAVRMKSEERVRLRHEREYVESIATSRLGADADPAVIKSVVASAMMDAGGGGGGFATWRVPPTAAAAAKSEGGAPSEIRHDLGAGFAFGARPVLDIFQPRATEGAAAAAPLPPMSEAGSESSSIVPKSVTSTV